MSSALAKYGYVFLTGLQSALVYRWNFLIRAAFSLVHLCVVFILWGAAYQGKTHLGGYTLDQTITYFVLLLFFQYLVTAFNEDHQIGEEIRNGMINQFLLKPVNYYVYRFSLFAAGRIVTAGLALVPLALLIPWLGDRLTLEFSGWQFGYGLPALLCAALLQFTLAYCFGLMAFWVLEINGLIILSMAFEAFLSGQMFPLDLLPPALYAASKYLPFYYLMYFPAGIFSGRLTPAEAAANLPIAIAWVVLALAAAQLLWRLGLKKHTAAGG